MAHIYKSSFNTVKIFTMEKAYHTKVIAIIQSLTTNVIHEHNVGQILEHCSNTLEKV